VLPVVSENLPTREWLAPAGRGGGQPTLRQVPTVFFNATRENKSGMIFLKVVNTTSNAAPVHIEISGVAGVDAKGEAVVLSADAPDATNSITEPNKIVPVTAKIDGLGKSFTRTFPPYSITVLRMKAM
jgi:alpha-N-arabinofuranosidase